MRRRLTRRFAPAMVEETIASLRERGLLDDDAFATSWRQHRERLRPRSATTIRWELMRMGVSRDVAENALQGLDEEGAAYRAARMVRRRLGREDYGTFRKRLAAYLGRRGFGPNTVRGTVERVWRELADPADSHIEGNSDKHKPEEDAEG